MMAKLKRISRRPAVFCCTLLTLSAAAMADPAPASTRPHLENYASYSQFLDALNAWQRQQDAAKKPKSSDASSQAGQLAAQPPASKAGEHAAPGVAAATPPKRSKESLEKAVQAARQHPVNADDDVSPDNDPDLQPTPAPALANTVISGALSAPAAGTNVAIGENKLRSNVDVLTNLNDISTADHGQSSVQPQSSPDIYSVPVPTSSSGTTASVGMQIHTAPTATVMYTK